MRCAGEKAILQATLQKLDAEESRIKAAATAKAEEEDDDGGEEEAAAVAAPEPAAAEDEGPAVTTAEMSALD